MGVIKKASKKVIIELPNVTIKQILVVAKEDQRKEKPLLKPFVEKHLINHFKK